MDYARCSFWLCTMRATCLPLASVLLALYKRETCLHRRVDEWTKFCDFIAKATFEFEVGFHLPTEVFFFAPIHLNSSRLIAARRSLHERRLRQTHLPDQGGSITAP